MNRSPASRSAWVGRASRGSQSHRPSCSPSRQGNATRAHGRATRHGTPATNTTKNANMGMSTFSAPPKCRRLVTEKTTAAPRNHGTGSALCQASQEPRARMYSQADGITSRATPGMRQSKSSPSVFRAYQCMPWLEGISNR